MRKTTSRGIREAGHIARIIEKINIVKHFTGKPEYEGPLG
jgi:hypothetical protein